MFDLVLAASTNPADQVGARWTSNVVEVTLMLYSRVTASSCSCTVILTGWWLRTAGKRSLKLGPPTVAGDILKNSLRTSAAWPSMTHSRTEMRAAVEYAAACLLAKMLCFIL